MRDKSRARHRMIVACDWRATFQNIEMPINDYRKNLCLKEINADFLIYIFHRTHSKHVHTLSSSTRNERPQAGVSACGLININTKQRSKTCGPSTIRTVTVPRRAKRFIELASAGGAEDQRARKMRARSLPPQGGLGFSRAFFPQDRNPKDRRSEDAKYETNSRARPLPRSAKRTVTAPRRAKRFIELASASGEARALRNLVYKF